MSGIKNTALIISISLLSCFAESTNFIKAGAGYGNGFGMFGAGIELEFSKISLLAGAGSYLTNEVAYDAGVRYYLANSDKPVRAHVTISYGPTEVHNYTQTVYEANGVTVHSFQPADAVIFGGILMGGVDFNIPTLNNLIMSLGLGIGSPLFGLPVNVENDYKYSNVQAPDLEDQFRLALGLKYLFGI